MGIGGTGRRGDAVADGLEEALALDHLEIAEAHRVTGPGLEVREVRVPGRRVDGGVAGVLARAEELELVQALEAPCQCALGAVHLKAHARMRADTPPAGLQRRAQTGLELD